MGPISTVQTGLSTRGQARGDNVSTGLLLQGWGDRPPRKVHVAISHLGPCPRGSPRVRVASGEGWSWEGAEGAVGGCCSHMGITQMTEPTETRTPRWSPRGLEGWGRGAPKDSPAFDPYPCALWSSCWRRWHLGRPWGALEPRLTSPKPHHSGPELQTGRLRLRSLSVVWLQPEGGRARI